MLVVCHGSMCRVTYSRLKASHLLRMGLGKAAASTGGAELCPIGASNLNFSELARELCRHMPGTCLCWCALGFPVTRDASDLG